jgi:hypothetical protein
MCSLTQRLTIAFLAFSISNLAAGALRCDHPDSDFKTFLERFKNDVAFQHSRLVIPLQISSLNPTGKTQQSLSLTQIRNRKTRVIRDDVFAAELKGTEGELCESVSVLKTRSVVFEQHSCSTDVYGSVYRFTMARGCWFLRSVHESGM